jgi:hypothetical protein
LDWLSLPSFLPDKRKNFSLEIFILSFFEQGKKGERVSPLYPQRGQACTASQSQGSSVSSEAGVPHSAAPASDSSSSFS